MSLRFTSLVTLDTDVINSIAVTWFVFMRFQPTPPHRSLTVNSIMS